MPDINYAMHIVNEPDVISNEMCHGAKILGNVIDFTYAQLIVVFIRSTSPIHVSKIIATPTSLKE